MGSKRAPAGDILISVLIFATVAITIIIGLVNWGAAMLMSIRTVASREQAFQIAEAGLDYYQWHLAQFPTDFTDGTTTPQPYVHTFNDKDGNLLGTYSLTITPPPVGSTIVTITSVGTLASTSISRAVKEQLAIPSLAKFAAVADDFMRFGAGTEVFGPIQSNNGVHFDGIAHNLVSSALATITDPDTDLEEWGVFTQSGADDPQPPPPNGSGHGPVNNRPDVFIAGRQFPVPAYDFSGLTADLTSLQTKAQNGGKEWTASGASGYHIVFSVVGGVARYKMYEVTALESTPNNCGNDATALGEFNSGGTANNGTNWGTWSIRGVVGSTQNLTNETLIVGPNPDQSWPIPGNDIIFVDDDVWVDGTIGNARVTVASGIIGASTPNNYTNITVNTGLHYTYTDGTDSIGLIAQGNVNVGMVSDDSFEIDGALVAENGRVGRFYYNSNCKIGSNNYSSRTSLTLYGMIATAIRYGFAYTDNTGYAARNIIYDANLLYAPPPSFPQATTQYQVISWQQLQ
jgi:hypothetical protein